MVPGALCVIISGVCQDAMVVCHQLGYGTAVGAPCCAAFWNRKWSNLVLMMCTAVVVKPTSHSVAIEILECMSVATVKMQE